MAPTRKNPQRHVNLASRMEKSPSLRLKDIKALAASNPRDFDVNSRNRDGKTALMFACWRGDEKTVKYLIDQGANLNTQCKRGNTPMHYAVSDSSCCCVGKGICSYKSSLNPFSKVRRLDILRLLISHGATPVDNSKGLSPSLLAALHQQSDFVNFFVQRNTRYLQLSDAEQIRVLQILGVMMALESISTYDRDSITDSLYHLSRAVSLRKKTGVEPSLGKKSRIAAAFSMFSEMELKPEDWGQAEKDLWAVRTQAFCIAERVLPEEMKDTYLFPRLLFHARLCVFQFGNIKSRLLQGIQIFQDAVQWELTSKPDIGSVLGCIMDGFRTSQHEVGLLDKVKDCLPVMNSCLGVFEGASGYHLQKVQKQLLQKLGACLLDFAMTNYYISPATFEALVSFGEQFVRVVRRECKGRIIASVTHRILQECGTLPELSHRSSRRMDRVTFLLSKLVQCEDATHCTAEGDTMLHSLVNPNLAAHPQFLKDVGLILIRNGCDPKKRNNKGKTWDRKIRHLPYPYQQTCRELKDAISNQRKTLLTLEEIAARTVLRHSIFHEGILPRQLSSIISGGPLPKDNSYANYKYGHDSVYDSVYDSEYDSESDWFSSDSEGSSDDWWFWERSTDESE